MAKKNNRKKKSGNKKKTASKASQSSSAQSEQVVALVETTQKLAVPDPEPEPSLTSPPTEAADDFVNAMENTSDNSDGIFGLDTTEDAASVILLPVPIDATASYQRGAALGPSIIAQASSQLDLFDPDMPEAGKRSYQHGIYLVDTHTDVLTQYNDHLTMLVDEHRAEGCPEASPLLDEINDIGKEVEQMVHHATSQWIAQGKIVGVIGGDHSVSFGAIRAYAEHVPNLGVLHIDAHADLRKAYEGFEHSHASIMHNVLANTDIIQLVQVGLRDFAESEYHRFTQDARIKAFTAATLVSQQATGSTFSHLCNEIIKELPQHVYISVDIDGLDWPYCPHTGTPVPGGLSWNELIYLLNTLAHSGRTVVGFDLCEVGNQVNNPAEWDGNVGARLLYKLIGVALGSKLSG